MARVPSVLNHPDPNNQPAMQGIRRLSVAHFLVALVFWIVSSPFVDELAYGDLIDGCLITLVFLSAVMAVGSRHRTLVVAGVLVAPALGAIWIDHLWPDAIAKEFALVTAILFTGFVAAHLLVFIFRAPNVDQEVLCAAVSVFLMLGVFGAFGYALVARLVPNSFVFTVGSDTGRSMTGLEALYFSFGALTNYYGDIIPVSSAARMLALVQSIVGVFYLALLVARLVGLYSGNRRADS
jgi:voltage-gated potassium channel